MLNSSTRTGCPGRLLPECDICWTHISMSMRKGSTVKAVLYHTLTYAWFINGFWIGWLDLLTPYTLHTTRYYRQYGPLADLHTLQFTVTHALGFSVFTSRILATDFITVSLSLQITHEVIFSQPNSFLAIILQLPTQFSSSAPSFITRQAGVSKLDSILLNWTLLYNHFVRTTQKTQPLYCWEGLFTAPLHSNGSYSIVASVFIAAGMCLPSCCLAMNVYSDFIIPAFGRHVTIRIKWAELPTLNFKMSHCPYCHVYGGYTWC
jgi:hypothetical protein